MLSGEGDSTNGTHQQPIRRPFKGLIAIRIIIMVLLSTWCWTGAHQLLMLKPENVMWRVRFLVLTMERRRPRKQVASSTTLICCCQGDFSGWRQWKSLWTYIIWWSEGGRGPFVNRCGGRVRGLWDPARDKDDVYDGQWMKMWGFWNNKAGRWWCLGWQGTVHWPGIRRVGT